MELKQTTLSDGTKLHYHHNEGREPAIVFLHGDGANSSVWVPFMEHFKDRSFLAPDLRGHGRSSRGEISIERFSEDIREIAEKEGLKKLILVGNCLGASVALEFYKKQPEMVEKMVLISLFSKRYTRMSAVLDGVNNMAHFFLSRLNSKRAVSFQDYSKIKSRSLLEYTLADMKGTRFTVYSRAAKELFRHQIITDEIKVPTLVVQGKKDLLALNKKIEKDVSRNSSICLRYIDDGHLILVHKSEDAISMMDDFL